MKIETIARKRTAHIVVGDILRYPNRRLVIDAIEFDNLDRPHIAAGIDQDGNRATVDLPSYSSVDVLEEHEIEVGTPLTLYYPQDRIPYVVVGIDTRTKIRIARLNTDGIKPDHHTGPWPVMSHHFTADEIAAQLPALIESGGHPARILHNRVHMNHADIAVGGAWYYRDYSY